MAAARYVALNPVRARLVERAQDWRVVERAGASRRGATTEWCRRRRSSRARPAASPIFLTTNLTPKRRLPSGGRRHRPTARLSGLPRPSGWADGPQPAARKAGA